jgi:hypothetical protein
MTPDRARILLAALPSARERWLTNAVAKTNAESLWLTGSLGRNAADAWSDVDLIVVGGDPALDGALLSLENAYNGPAGGGYVGAMYELDELTLWVDWYRWPAGALLPRDAKPLAGGGRQGGLDLCEALDRIGRGRPAPTPDPVLFALAMLPLAAKFVGRGETAPARAMAAMLGAPPELPPADGLCAVLSRLFQLRVRASLRERVARYLEVARALAPAATGPGGSALGVDPAEGGQRAQGLQGDDAAPFEQRGLARRVPPDRPAAVGLLLAFE